MPPHNDGFRGTTVLPVTWTVVRNEHGDRHIEGIAYNAAIKGERRRLTCSDEVWNDPDEDVFYSDEAVRWTVRQLTAMKLYGTPVRFMHKERMPAVGKIMSNFVDSQGNLHIVATLKGDSKYGRKAIEFVDSGECHELSVGYGLHRNERTKEVSHGNIDEVSIVPEAHFRGCKVNVKAGRSGQGAPGTGKPRQAPYSVFRAVRAGLTASNESENPSSSPPPSISSIEKVHHQQGFRMTDAPASNAPPPTSLAGLAAQIPKDLGFAGAPPALADAVEAMRKIMMQQSEEVLRLAEQNKRFLDAETKRKEAEKAEAQRYAESRQGVAKDLVAEMIKIAVEDGMADPSEAYAKMAMEMHTDNSPLSKENQAVTVACMRKISKQSEELAAIKARNLELETAAKTLHDMTTVDEAERSERRDLKAGRRNAGMTAGVGSIMQPDTEEDDGSSRGLASRPSWLRTMAAKNPYTGSSGGYAPRNEFDTRPQQRGVYAGRAATPAPAQTQAAPPARTAVAPVVPQSVPAPAQQRGVVAGRNGVSNGQQPPPSVFGRQQAGMTLGPTNRMDISNPEFYAWLQEARSHADFTTGSLYHMAGHEMSAPQELRWGGGY